jgi:YD repeat-containing protein
VRLFLFVSFFNIQVITEKTNTMKKILFLILTFSLTFKFYSLKAQDLMFNRTDLWYSYIMNYENQDTEKTKVNHVKEKQIINSKHLSHITTYDYDTAGRVIDYRSGWNTQVKTAYDQNGLKTFLAVYRKGKLTELDSFYWENKKIRTTLTYNDKNKLIQKQLYNYDSSSVKEYVQLKLKSGKFVETRKTVYEYYPDYSYKKITYYKKGKPNYFTVFDCDPAGLNHKVNKDSLYSCIKYDVDSLGNKIKISVTNEKDRCWKRVEYFNKRDERIAEKTFDLKKNDELLWVYYFKPGKFIITKFISYKKKKEYYRTEKAFDNSDNCTESSTYIHGKIKYKTVNSFNEKGLIVKTEDLNKKDKKKKEVSYLYQYY